MTNLGNFRLSDREIAQRSTHRERDPGAMVVLEETEDSPKRSVIDVVLPFCQMLTYLSPH